ncbi:4-coumarate--CoA ligase 3 [Aphelenchoides besseyi]|nr:4-coumarate--CoA ligase 3 [Aphelenchoides besseyi]KAI6222822.1 4-coumarate--CoA ligase 3 [Aphelenchoides besseyi]
MLAIREFVAKSLVEEEVENRTLRSDFPNVPIDERPFGLQFMDALYEHALKNPMRIAMVGDNRVNADDPTDCVNYEELIRLSHDVEDFLRGINYGKDDVACTVMPNCWQFASIFAGVSLTGGTLSTSPIFTSDEIERQLNDCGASVVFCHFATLTKTRKALEKCPKVKTVIVIRKQNSSIELQKNEIPFELLSSLIEQRESRKYERTFVNVHKDSLLLIYSSGTTSLPKGVNVSHFNFSAATAAYQQACDYSISVMPTSVLLQIDSNYNAVDDTLLLIPPFYHIYGIFTLVQSLMLGTKCVVVRQFNGEQFCSLIEKHKIKTQMLVPSLIHFLATSPIVDQYDLRSLRLLISGGAPLSRELAAAVQKRLPSLQFIGQAYGMSELTCISHYPYPSADLEEIVSVGKLAPNLELRIVDVKTGLSLSIGEVGEIRIRGPIVMHGYLNNSKETKEIIDADGFLKTGDVGYVDPNTRLLYVVDRIKELIKVNGRQVAPCELENLLAAHPLVSDCAVIGVQHQRYGEVPRAFVVTNSTALTESELVEFVGRQVASYKQLKGGVEFIDEIPKTKSGKVLRRELKAFNSKL